MAGIDFSDEVSAFCFFKYSSQIANDLDICVPCSFFTWICVASEEKTLQACWFGLDQPLLFE